MALPRALRINPLATAYNPAYVANNEIYLQTAYDSAEWRIGIDVDLWVGHQLFLAIDELTQYPPVDTTLRYKVQS